MGKVGQLPGGIVLVGGGSKLPGLAELVRQELKLTSQIGCTVSQDILIENTSHEECVEDPEYVCALGLMRWGADEEGLTGKSSSSDSRFGFKKLFRYFIP